MSENIDFILKPKVRFSQFSDKKRNNEIIKESCKDDTNLQTNGPKIRSIITLKKPIKIVDSVESANVHEKDLPMKNCEIKTSTCSNYIMSENTQDTSLPNDNMSETEVLRILRSANNSRDKKENRLLQLDKNICMQYNTLKHCKKILQQKGKENKDKALNKIVSNKNIIKTTKNCQYKQPIVSKKLKFSTSNNDVQEIDNTNSKRTEMIKSRFAPSVMKRTERHTTRTFNTKLALSNVTPCYRYMKTEIMKNKVSPVKKTILSRTCPNIKTAVGSKIYHKQQDNTKTDNASEKCIMSDAVEKLAQPRYNSIMCTFNKFKEIKQKIIRDINHLSPIQKDLLNEKISTALDFPLDEIIFKNLVDLNIDDKQMCTTMRSKDPEPRQKDIIPKLSDFFMPEHTKDICTHVHVKLRASKIKEDWNTFKISNKILEWRQSLDDVQ